MKGRRLPDGFEPTMDWYQRLGVCALMDLAGGYGKDSAGKWCVVTPNGRSGCVAAHTVTEHPDGTITVSPSILVHAIPPRCYEPAERQRLVELSGEDYVRVWEAGLPEYHGWLQAGEWRDC